MTHDYNGRFGNFWTTDYSMTTIQCHAAVFYAIYYVDYKKVILGGGFRLSMEELRFVPDQDTESEWPSVG